MLTPRERVLLEGRRDTYFMNWLSRWIPLSGLSEREQYVLCRDAFRMTVLALSLLAWLVPMGMVIETVFLVAIPNYLFFSRWAAWAKRQQAIRVRSSDQRES
ncbi:MAG: hypothetical protein D6758_12735 [Gammaproteobacteria bacterium]|nr:MAG: hypothetical protein D6758_12735 [Gammaproteobacteria bacterium]